MWNQLEPMGNRDGPPDSRDLQASMAISAKRQADAWERVVDALAIRKGEADYAAFCARENPDGTLDSLERSASMLEQWGPETFPADPNGKVHFGRALTDSVAAEIRAFLTNFSAVTANDA